MKNTSIDLPMGYIDCSNEEYHADRTAISSSGLKTILKDGEEYYEKYILGKLDDSLPKAALEFGSFVHSLILEPHLTDGEFVKYPGATRRGKEYEKFKEDHKDKVILANLQYNKGKDLADAFHDNDHAMSFMGDGEAEKTLVVEMDDVKVKVRSDWLCSKGIMDVKTTSGDVTPKEVIKTIMHWGYDLSAALYCDAFAQKLGHVPDFYFVFLGKSNGKVGVYKASDQMIENGRKKYKAALVKLKKARETGVYFEVDETIKELYLPEYALWEGENDDL